MTPDEIGRNTILRVVNGSELYGTKASDSVGDRDELGVCIEPRDYILGLHTFDQYDYRDAVERARREGTDPNERSPSLGTWT